MRKFIGFAAAVMLAGCAGAVTDAPRTMQVEAPSQQLIRFYQSPCYFRCATYTIELRPDGSYILTWPQPEPATGPVTGKLGPDAWPKAVAAFDAAGFYAMPESLSASTLNRPGSVPCINDLPAVEFTRRGADGVQKTVHYDTGCPAPAAGKLASELREIFKDVPTPKGG